MAPQEFPSPLPDGTSVLGAVLYAVGILAVVFGRTIRASVRSRKEDVDADRTARGEIVQGWKDASVREAAENARLRSENSVLREDLHACQQREVQARMIALRCRGGLEMLEDRLTERWMKDDIRALLEETSALPALPDEGRKG